VYGSGRRIKLARKGHHTRRAAIVSAFWVDFNNFAHEANLEFRINPYLFRAPNGYRQPSQVKASASDT